MPSFKSKFLLFLLMILLPFFALDNSAGAGWGQEWRSYETDNFVLFFPGGYEEQGKELLFYLEQYLDDLKQLTGGGVDSKIHLNLEDMGLVPNGMADPINERMEIFAGSPGTDSNLAHYESWLRLVGVHELTHILHMTSTSGYSNITTSIFGNALAPNLHSPLWLIEGIAVYAESQSSPYEGRLNSGYYNGVLAQKASRNNIPGLPEITYRHFYYPPGHRYLYGSTFMRYLAEEYGEDKFAEFFDEYGSYYFAAGPANLFPQIGPGRAAEQVFGSDLEKLYDDWRQQERKGHEYWQIDGEILINAEHANLSNLQMHEGNLYYLQSQRYPSSPFSYHGSNKIKRYDPELDQTEVVMSTAAGISGTMQIEGDKIFYLQREAVGNYPNLSRAGRGIVTNLIAYDLASGNNSVLIQDEMRDFLVREEGQKIIYVRDRKNGFGSQLIKMDSGGNRIEKIEFPVLISELHSFDDEDCILLTAKERQASWGIFNLELSSAELTPVVNTAWPEMHLSKHEDKIIFTSNYEGYSGIYGYNTEEQQNLKFTHGGHGEQGVVLDESLYYLTYDDEGMALVEQSFSPEAVELPEKKYEMQQGGLLQSEIDELDFEEKGFWSQNLKELFPPSLRFPPVFFAGQDAVGMNSYTLNLNQYGKLDVSLNSQFFQPLNLSFRSRGRPQERENRLSGSYPLYRSAPDGLTDILLEAGTDFAGIFLGSSLRWRYPEHLVTAKLQTEVLTGDFQTELDYTNLRESGRIKLGGKYISGFDLNRNPRLPDYSGERGYHISAEYLNRLISVQQGSWNPNIFLGDIYGGLFIDYLNLDEEQISGGGKIELELGTANAFHTVPQLGIARTKDSWQPFVGMEVTF